MSPRPVAGVVVPHSKLTRDVTELVKNMKSPLLFHHPSRVYYWGALTGKHRASKLTGRSVCERLSVQWECRRNADSLDETKPMPFTTSNRQKSITWAWLL
jgi:hypothetical protein